MRPLFCWIDVLVRVVKVIHPSTASGIERDRGMPESASRVPMTRTRLGRRPIALPRADQPMMHIAPERQRFDIGATTVGPLVDVVQCR